MTSPRRFSPLLAFLLTLFLGGCGSSNVFEVFTGGSVAPVAGRVASVIVSPASLTLSKGEAEELEVVALYTNGSRHNVSKLVTWAVTPASVASVSPDSVVTAQAEGTAALVATFKGVSGSANLRVIDRGEFTSLAVSPSQAGILVGSQQQFTATAQTSTGQQIDVTSRVDWSSSDPATATVSNSNDSAGLAQGRTAGDATITARLGSLQAQADLTVSAPVLQTITVAPANPELHPGNAQDFTARGTFSDGSSRDITSQVTWSSSLPSVASIDAGGRATALTTGGTVIGAALQGVTGSTTLTVSAATLVSIDVLPAGATLAAGSDRQYQALGHYSDDSTIDITAEATWASTAGAVATVSTTGLVSAVAGGTSTISATLDGVTGSTGLTVSTPALVSIAITPAADSSIATGTTVAYRASGTFSDGSTSDVTQSVTWSTGDGSLATVSNAPGMRGQVTGVANGLVEIRATEGGVQAAVDARVMLYLYGTDGLSVYGHSVDPTSGALIAVPDPVTFDGCICQILVDPTNRFLYALDGENGQLFILDIEPATGRLLSRAGAVPTGEFPDKMALSPRGDTLYVSDAEGFLYGFTVAADGSLTPAATPTPVGMVTLSLDYGAGGDYLYAADLADNVVYGFAVNPGSGALTPLSGSPYATGDGPDGLASSVDGKFVYVLNSRDANISGYEIGPDGSLSALAGFPVDVGGAPYNLIADPLGRFFYAIDFSDASVTAFAADPTTGALTPVAGQPFLGNGELSSGITIDPSGRFLYTSFLVDPELNGFAIEASGALSELTGSPFPVEDPFEAIVTTH